MSTSLSENDAGLGYMGYNGEDGGVETKTTSKFQVLHKRTRASIRKALTGDRHRGVRDHIKRKVTQMENQPKTIKIFDKIAFSLGVLNLSATQYYVVAEPRKYWCWYSVIVPILLASRWHHFKENRMQYFLLDFCYSVNILSFIQLYCFYGNDQLFRMTYILATGPLPAAIPVWMNSLVFHDVDRTVSVYVHTLPMCLYYTCRALKHPALQDPLGLMDYVYALGFYLAWQILYLMQTEVVDKDKLEEEHLLTSLKWLSSNTRNALSGSVLRLCKKMGLFAEDETFVSKSPKTKAVFVVCQLIFTLVACVPTYWAWASPAFNLFYICVIFTTAIYFGGSYYVEVFSKRYAVALEKAAERAVAREALLAQGADLSSGSGSGHHSDGDGEHYCHEDERGFADEMDETFDALLQVDY